MAEIRKWSTEAAAAAHAFGEVRKYVRKVGDKWKVYSEEGDVLGSHASKEDATKQLAAIEVNKAMIDAASLIEKDEDFAEVTKVWSDEARAAAAEARRRNAKPGSAEAQLGIKHPTAVDEQVEDEQRRGKLEPTGDKPADRAAQRRAWPADVPMTRSNVLSRHQLPEPKPTRPAMNIDGERAMVSRMPKGEALFTTEHPKSGPWEHWDARGDIVARGNGLQSLHEHLADGAIKKAETTEFTDPSSTDILALQLAFGEHMKSAGFVLKAEQMEAITAEQIEIDGGVAIFRITHAMGRTYFGVSNGDALHLPQYRTVGKSGLVPIAKSEAQRYTLGVVYTHGESDFHNEGMSPEELEKAAWAFMAKDGMHGRVGLMHAPDTDGAGRVVESYIYRGPEWVAKAAADEEQNQTIKSGDWLLGVIWEPKAWALVQSGRVAGYSLQGLARKG